MEAYKISEPKLKGVVPAKSASVMDTLIMRMEENLSYSQSLYGRLQYVLKRLAGESVSKDDDADVCEKLSSEFNIVDRISELQAEQYETNKQIAYVVERLETL